MGQDSGPKDVGSGSDGPVHDGSVGVRSRPKLDKSISGLDVGPVDGPVIVEDPVIGPELVGLATGKKMRKKKAKARNYGVGLGVRTGSTAASAQEGNSSSLNSQFSSGPGINSGPNGFIGPEINSGSGPFEFGVNSKFYVDAGLDVDVGLGPMIGEFGNLGSNNEVEGIRAAVLNSFNAAGSGAGISSGSRVVGLEFNSGVVRPEGTFGPKGNGVAEQVFSAPGIVYGPGLIFSDPVITGPYLIDAGADFCGSIERKLNQDFEDAVVVFSGQEGAVLTGINSSGHNLKGGINFGPVSGPIMVTELADGLGGNLKFCKILRALFVWILVVQFLSLLGLLLSVPRGFGVLLWVWMMAWRRGICCWYSREGAGVP